MDPDEGAMLPVLLDQTLDKIVLVDADGEYLYVNAAARRILGFEPETLVGTNAFEYIHPVDRDPTWATFESVVDADEPIAETVSYRHRDSEGGWIWLESRFSNRTDESLGGYVISSREITRRREAERERAAVEEQFIELSQAANDVLWLFEGDWSELLFLNSAYETVYRQSSDEVRADPTAFLDTVHPDDVDLVVDAMDRLSAGEAVDIEYRVNPDRDYGVWVWVQGTPIIRDGTVDRIAGFTRDISDRRRRERQLVVMGNILRHNLRNDMTTIVGNAELIADRGGEAVEPFVETIVRVGEALLEDAETQRRIIDLLTDHEVPTVRDIAAIVETEVATLRETYPDAVVETDIPATADAAALPEIAAAVGELLDNAVVHAETDAPTVAVSVRVDEQWVTVEVCDDCPPIPREEFRVLTGEQPMDEVTHTTGLGLWLVFWSVDLSGGRIEFDETDRGNRISISLPVR
ncbi:PAS domain S-box protein [Haloarcula montana]|uniref:PAS domain S-box protein n=1 Tax=Haloarcula montana TaxID=3111776 RepID=UPI002D795BFA|nr:PAS domain S-box protein [Haloarcula sp. GH36]